MQSATVHVEGTAFGVPLDRCTWGRGVVARRSNELVLGYFFGPRLYSPPAAKDVGVLAPDDAVLICRCSNMGLQRGMWPTLGHFPTWHRAKWRVPPFCRCDAITGAISIVRYLDSNIEEEVSVRPLRGSAPRQFPEDGIAGHEFVQLRLSQLLPRSKRRATLRQRNSWESSPANDACGMGRPRSEDGRQVMDADDSIMTRIEHYFYFKRRAASLAAASDLRGRGLTVTIQRSAESPLWLVLASHVVGRYSPGDVELERQMENVAEAHSGEYDGWEADVS